MRRFHGRPDSLEPAMSGLDLLGTLGLLGLLDRLLVIAFVTVCFVAAGIVTSAYWSVPFDFWPG